MLDHKLLADLENFNARRIKDTFNQGDFGASTCPVSLRTCSLWLRGRSVPSEDILLSTL
jgi:hypothetical protein